MIDFAKKHWILISVLTIALILILIFSVKRKEIIEYVMSKQQQPYIDKLNKSIQERFKKVISRIEKETGWSVYITSGYRTFAKQAELHEQNPSNAKAGYSLHNYGLAIDFNLFKGVEWIRKASPKSKWEETGAIKIIKEEGFRWGGDFKTYYDPVHIDIYYPTSELLAIAQSTYGTSPSAIKGNEIQLT